MSLILDQLTKVGPFVGEENVSNVVIVLQLLKRLKNPLLLLLRKKEQEKNLVGRKLLRGLLRACEKRPVSLKELEDLTASIEKELRNQGVSEIKSEELVKWSWTSSQKLMK